MNDSHDYAPKEYEWDGRGMPGVGGMTDSHDYAQKEDDWYGREMPSGGRMTDIHDYATEKIGEIRVSALRFFKPCFGLKTV